MVSTITNLDTVVQEYLQDSIFLAERENVRKQRSATIPHYQHLITQFVNGTLNLDAFRNGLKALHRDTFWGGKGAGFLVEINKLVLHHLPRNPELETHIRFILNGLSAENMGQHIEQLYNLLSKERESLLQAQIPSNKAAFPKTSAFIISLFAFWNDYTHRPYIYYPALRVGLAALLTSKLIPASSDIKLESNGVRILSEADHQAVTHTLDNLGNAFPALKTDEYWAEHFMIWLTKRITANPTYLKNPTYILGGLEEEDVTEESATEEELEEQGYTLLEDTSLAPTDERRLSQGIAELRRHLLIEEKLVRRIYYALLNGHVIFTGPPGTGKTELARLLPELLWQGAHDPEDVKSNGAHTAYTATLVTATNEWSTRTLISSIAPIVNTDKVAYRTQYGHLTDAILRNWAYTIQGPAQWKFHGRKSVQGSGYLKRDTQQEFRGHWLIIDEFNRAPIDAALGEALTTLSDGEALLVPVDGTHIKLPLPKDFRIIGTLNNFDRNYLNKISEALKRRFAFIEILPPSRAARAAEQNIVLYKALQQSAHLSQAITIEGDNVIEWEDVVIIAPDKLGNYVSVWHDEAHPFYTLFYTVVWPLFEVIRVYRRLGTAQAIALLRHILTQGLLERFSTSEQWMQSLDYAFCEVIADQLQVLLPDELEVLSWYLKYDAASFIARYNAFLAQLAGRQRRLSAHLEALSAVVNDQGKAILSEEEAEQLLEDEEPHLNDELLTAIFRLEYAPLRLPQLSHRLRTLKAERGL